VEASSPELVSTNVFLEAGTFFDRSGVRLEDGLRLGGLAYAAETLTKNRLCDPPAVGERPQLRVAM
jgi:hypothetical protein